MIVIGPIMVGLGATALLIGICGAIIEIPSSDGDHCYSCFVGIAGLFAIIVGGIVGCSEMMVAVHNASH